MGDHHVRERAVVQVVSGRVSIESSGEAVECNAGALTFAPSERHRVGALTDARLLLILAPWPQPSTTQTPRSGTPRTSQPTRPLSRSLEQTFPDRAVSL
jgi:quercetin dioxygenase-like cupin family protein